MKIGIDVAKLDRFVKLVENQSFLERVFTQKEIEHIFLHGTIEGKIERLAGKFCAKEACIKALQQYGVTGVYLTDIETYHDKNGCPKLRLLKKISKNLRFKLSISHDKTKAIAFVIAK